MKTFLIVNNRDMYESMFKYFLKMTESLLHLLFHILLFTFYIDFIKSSEKLLLIGQICIFLILLILFINFMEVILNILDLGKDLVKYLNKKLK
jgi:hypothetical protein